MTTLQTQCQNAPETGHEYAFFALSVTRHPFMHWTALNPLFSTAIHSLSHIFQREDSCLLLLLATWWQSFPHNILAHTDESTTRARIVIYFSQYFTSSCTSFDDMARTIWTLCAYRVRKRFFSSSPRCDAKENERVRTKPEAKRKKKINRVSPDVIVCRRRRHHFMIIKLK